MNRRPTPETDNNDYAHAFLEQYGYESSLQDAPVDWPDFARRLERERDEVLGRVKELIHENENLYRRLESIHEVYRLSSVCRELKAENEKLKQQQP